MSMVSLYRFWVLSVMCFMWLSFLWLHKLSLSLVLLLAVDQGMRSRCVLENWYNKYWSEWVFIKVLFSLLLSFFLQKLVVWLNHIVISFVMWHRLWAELVEICGGLDAPNVGQIDLLLCGLRYLWKKITAGCDFSIWIFLFF